MKWILTTLFPSLALAWIPPARMIIERTSDNAGNGTYVIEQEVSFPNGNDTLNLRETWVVENDHSMKVTVTGPRELPGLKMQILYVGGLRWLLENGRRESGPIPPEMAERFFHWRTAESAAQQLTALKIIPPHLLQKKAPPRKADEIHNEAEEGVRLSRTNGVIAYAFGQPSTPGSGDKPPGLWIEQDQFLVRKVQLPSQAEITADNYSSYARGLQFPKNRAIQWGPHTVNLRVISVTGRTGGASLSTTALDSPWKTQALEGQPARDVVEEFYKRFR